MLSSFQKIPSLDGIRAISVLIVVLSHAGYGNIIPGGLGVTIFFFLSGYLITTLLLAEHERTGSIDVRGFYLRRFLRLTPPLFLTLAIAYGLVLAGLLPGGITLGGVLAQSFYMANYFNIYNDIGSTVPYGTVVLWSLSVEEHFYLFYPLLLLALLSSGVSRARIGYIIVGVCTVVLCWRIHLVAQPGFIDARTGFATDTRIDSILFGSLLAVWNNPMVQTSRPAAMGRGQWAMFAGSLALILFTLVYRDASFRETFRYSLQGIALYGIFFFCVRFHDNALFRHLNSSIITKLGVWSYGIYLSHLVIIQLVATQWSFAADKPMLLFLAAVIGSISFAMIIEAFVDPYFRKRRQVRAIRKVQSAAPAAG